MITKEQWLKLVSKVDQTFEDEFKAEFNSPELMFPIVQRLLQQTPCTTQLPDDSSTEDEYCQCESPTLGTNLTRCGTCYCWFKPIA